MRRFVICAVALFMAIGVASAQEVITRDDIKSSVTAYAWQQYEVGNDAFVATPEPPVVPPQVDIPCVKYKNFIQVGMGLPSLVQALLFDFYVDGEPLSIYDEPTLSNRLAEERYYWGKERLVSAINLEYGYKVKDGLSLGAKLYTGFTTRSRRHVITDELLYRDYLVVASAIFNVRFDWLRREWVTMYSSIGVGAVALIVYDYNEIYPMYDATFVGLGVGRRFYGYVEVGSGVSGSLRAGLGVRF